MKKHIKVYTDYFGIGYQDNPICEIPSCCIPIADIHHCLYKSQGGKDNIENLIGLCRGHHEMAHSKELSCEYLQKVHDKNIQQTS